jgi:hypothetical protein
VAECDWAILCDYSFLDVNRKLCLIGIFDRVFAERVPTAHHNAGLAVKIIGEPNEKVQLKVEIVRPAGGTLGNLSGEATLSEDGLGQIQLNLGDLPLPDWGLYAFNIYLGDQLAKTTGFTVAAPVAAPAER